MQTSLFYDDIYDAIRDVVNALGGPKAVGTMLWPDKSMAMAHTALLNCLDRNRPEKLDPTQLVLLLKKGRSAECHAAMRYLCAECGYDEPVPLAPEDEKARLQRQVIESVDDLKKVLTRLEQLESPKLKGVA